MGKIESKLFWMNYFRNSLDKHNEFLVRFCSISSTTLMNLMNHTRRFLVIMW